MENVINLGIPHFGELIFESFDTFHLVNCLEVSETWKVLAKNVLTKRWKGKMFEACKSGKTKVVELLLENLTCEENGLNVRDEHGMTVFIRACRYGHKYIVKLLLDFSDRNIDLNARNSEEMTGFMVACFDGHKDVVRVLLDNSERIDLNTTDNDGDTAFMIACCFGHKDEGGSRGRAPPG